MESFGFRSRVAFEEGLRRTVAWYQETRSTSAGGLPVAHAAATESDSVEREN
jgi:dTDP-D-glucose 4,6-dehydratase